MKLSPKQEATLRAFARLVEERALDLGLVSAGDLGRTYDRHVLDSVRAASLFREEDHTAVDIGSGAGFPGIPLAIALPRCDFLLVEPRRRRAGFLELAVDRLALTNVRVAYARAETIDLRFDLATARAFAELPLAWQTAHRLLRPRGRLIYWAGERLSGAGAVAALSNSPSPPVRVTLDPVLENSNPLVIMVRG